MSTFANADAYDQLMGRWSRLLGHELVRFAGNGRGRVLDVGCGTGSLAAAVLESHPEAEVVGVDPSEAFVSGARERVRDARARFEIADAQQLPFPDAAFDAALSMLVLNFVPRPAEAAAEMRRVTRPGGRVAACVWDYGGGMTMLRRFWEAAIALDPAAAARHENLMPLCASGELETLWHETGLEAVRGDALTIEMRFASFADFWRPFLAGVGPAGSYTASLAPERRRALEDRLRADWGVDPYAARTLPARAWAAVGTVP